MTISSKDNITTKEPIKKAKKPRAKRKPTNKQSTRAPNSPKAASNTVSSQAHAKAQLRVIQENRDVKFHDGAWLVPSSFEVSHIPPSKNMDDGNNLSVANAYGGSFSSFLEEERSIIGRALHNNGLNQLDISSKGIGCLIEQGRKFVLELLADATDYAGCDGNMQDLNSADLMLVSELREDGNEKNLDISLVQHANETNKRLIPPIPSQCYNGIVLRKNEPHTLLDRTFDIIPSSTDLNTHELKQAEERYKPIDSVQTVKKNKGPSYGASKGKQIEVTIKSTIEERVI